MQQHSFLTKNSSSQRSFKAAGVYPAAYSAVPRYCPAAAGYLAFIALPYAFTILILSLICYRIANHGRSIVCIKRILYCDRDIAAVRHVYLERYPTVRIAAFRVQI